MPDIAARIAVLIIDRPLCIDCIADRGQIGVATVKEYLQRIDPIFSVNRHADDRCRACGHIGRVVSLSRRAH
jgi:hypothetical protein